MTKFVRVMVIVFTLVLLFSECHSAGMHKLPRRKSNSERDYGLLGNFIAAMADRWYAPPRAPGDEGVRTQPATKPQTVASKPSRKSAKRNSKSRTSASKASKQARADQSQHVFPFGVAPMEPAGQRDNGLLGNLIVSLVDRYNGVSTSNGSSTGPRETTTQSLPSVTVSDSDSNADSSSAGGGLPSNPSKGTVGQRDYGPLGNLIASLVDRYNGISTTDGNAEAMTDGPPSSSSSSLASASAVDDEDIDLSDDEELDSDDEKTSTSSTSLCQLSPAERLKHLIEPFVLNLMVDDGGLRDAVEKLRSWQAQERYENLNYIGGGIAAL